MEDGERHGRHVVRQPDRRADSKVAGELALGEKLADKAFVGRLMRTGARAVRMVVAGKRRQTCTVRPTRKRVQTRPAARHGGVQRDQYG